MVAVVAGNGLGLFNASVNVLGSAGMLGRAGTGQAGGRCYVNVATGNLVLQAYDERLAGRGLDLQHVRTHNSLGQANDGDGDGWRWDGERVVAAQGPIGAAGSTVIRTDSDGHATTYTWNGTAYSSTEGGGAHDAITHDASAQQFVWTDGSTRLIERYAVGTGRLASQQDVSGNRIDFGYDAGSGRLTDVVDSASGQRLVLTYATVPTTSLTRLQKVETRALTENPPGKPTETVGAAVRQVEYGYDTSGRLTSVKSDLTPSTTSDAVIFVTTYTYDGGSGRVAKVSYSDGTTLNGTTLTFAYEADSGRFSTATDASGVQTFTYTTTGTGANATVSTDVSVDAGSGSQTWTYVSNAKQQLIEVKSPPPTPGAVRLTTQFVYDAAGNAEGNVRRIIDAQGNAVDYEYDGLGNRKLERDSLGNTLLRTFDGKNQVVTETRHGVRDPDGTGPLLPESPVTDRFVYDGQSRLRFAVSAEGVVTENRYGTVAPAVGLLTHSLVYAGGRYSVGGMTPPQVLSESQLITWVGGQDKTKVELTEFTYDLRGNVSKQIDYATTNSAGGVLDAGAVVREFVYDGHGDLIKTLVVRGSARDLRTELATATYDGLGRLKQMIDSSGSTTTNYDDASRKIRVNTQAGLMATRSFDDRGRLVGVTQQAGADGASRASLLVYDGAGRLRMAEDPQGGRRFLFYDAADRVRFQVDAAGSVTGLAYNANGKVTTQTQFRNVANTSSWYNTTDKTVTKHALTLGGAGSDVVVDAAHDRVLAYAYDTASRLKTSTDAVGTVSDTTYDGRSLVSKQQTANRSVQYFYDRDDRVVGTVDAMGFLAEYKYDGAGRLSETVRYNTRSTAATNIVGALAAPLWVGVSNQTATGGRPFEYRMPAVDADTDTVAYTFVGAKPEWLEPIDTSTGVAILKGKPPAAPASYSVVVQADDQRGQTSNATVQIAVVNKPPTWAPVPIQHLIAGQVFKLIVPAAVDPEGLAPTYSVVSKPSWLTFSAGTRELSGTPTAVGFAVVELRATDLHGGIASMAVGLNIGNTSNNPPIWAQLPPASMTAASPANYTPPAAQDPDGQFMSNYIAASGLPAGLSVNSKNGSLVGTTKAVGTHSVVLRAIDPLGASVDRTLSLEVRNALPLYIGGLADQAFDSMEFPSPFAFPMPDNAFVDPNDDQLTYTANEGATGWPSWLTFDEQNLTFHGTIPAGRTNTQSFPITVTAHDGRGGTVSGSFSLTVRPLVTGFAAKPRQTAAVAPVDDVLAPWRPSSTAGLRSYLFYDGQGRVTVSIDEQGFPTETLYDAAANKQQTLRYPIAVAVVPSDTPTSIKARAGAAKAIATVEYDDMGRMVRVIGEDGTATQTEYDAAGRAVRVIAAAGATSATDVAESGAPRAGRVRLNEFGEVTGTLNGVGDATLPASPTQAQIDLAITARGMQLESDSLGRRAKAIDANGHASLLFYDRENRLTHTINAEREITETGYNSSGQAEVVRRYFNRITPENLAGLTGGPASQLQGKLPAQDQSKDQLTRFEYDRRGLLTKQIDPEGFVTNRTYNQHGQLEIETRTITQTPNTTVATRFDYDLRGGLIAQTSDLGGVNLHHRTSYDGQGRPVRMVDGAGNATTTSYLDAGRAIEVTDPLNRKVRTEFDALGRVSKRLDASTTPAITTYTYDDSARKVTTTSPEGVVVATRKTRHGEILDVTDGEGGITKYEYNKDGQLIKVIEPNGTPGGQVIRTNTYDDSGRLETTTDGRGTVVRFDYDAVDRVREQHIDPAADNVTTAYEFNALGQTVKVTEGKGTPAELVTSYDYDRNGRPRAIVVDPNGLKLSTTYSYEGLGDKVTIARGTVTEPNQLVTRYEFDKLGRKTKQIDAPSAVLGTGAPGTRDLTTQYRYDAAGRLSRIIDPIGNSTWSVYDAAGQITHVINAEGEVGQNRYDANGRLVHTRRHVNRLSATVLNSLDDVVTAATITAASTTSVGDQRSYLVYDKDGRLRFTLTADQDAKWVIGENRYSANSNNLIETRRYDKFLSDTRVNAIDTTASPGITVTEVNTELTGLGYSGESTLVNIQRTRYAYHANNRLRFTVDAQGAVTENVYDPMGALVATIRYAVKPALTEYTQNAINAVVDRINVGNQVTRYSYDTQDRLRFTLRVEATDGTGKATQHLVSEQRYDSLGRPTESIQYVTAVGALADYRAATIAMAVTTHADNRRQVSVYDTAGRQIYAVRVLATGAQGKHLVMRTEYDAVGRAAKRTEFATELGLANLARGTLDTAVGANASARDRVTSFVYDVAGRLRFAIAPDGTLQESLYDAGGRLTEKRMFDLTVPATTPRTEAALSTLRGNRRVGDGVTRGKRYNYDRVGRLDTTTDAKGFHETNEYNGLGDRTSHIDNNGAICTYVYDRRGRVFRKITQPVEVFVQLTGQSTPSVQEASLEDRTIYDAFGNIKTTIERANTTDARTSDYTYDTLGRLDGTLLPGFYDPAAGKVEKTTSAGRFRREVLLAYDVFGQLVRTRTRTGASTFQNEYKTYDRLGRVKHDVDAMNHAVAFKYTTFGDQEHVTRHGVTITGTPPNGSHWTETEIAGKVGTDPKARVITTKYDNAGRKSEVKLPQAAYYHGDTAQRVNLATLPPTESMRAATSYEYTAFSEVRHEAVQINATQWRDTWHYFDTMGRKTANLDGLGHLTKQSYDPFGNLGQSIEYATAGVAPTTGDAQPSGTDNGNDRITKFGYDTLNQRTKVERLGARYTAWITDAYFQLNKTRTEATTLQDFTYDGIGRVRTQTDGLGSVTHFSYNALGQLKQITEPARGTAGAAAVDPFVGQVSASPVTTLTLNGFGEVIKQTRSSGGAVAGGTLTVEQAFDAAGNIVTTIDAMGNSKSRQYDYAGRVLKETQPVNVTMSGWMTNSHTVERRYAYDASGQQTDTIDVFKEGTATCWSGVRNLYDEFGAIKEERRIWQDVSTQGDAIVALYTYDNAGQAKTRTASDGVTHFYYGLAGDVTRQEQRGTSGALGETTRITENGIDLLGRARVQRLPACSAVTAPVSLATTQMTPLALQDYDRWGNVITRTEGRYVRHDTNAVAGDADTTTYQYNADNQPTDELLPTATAVRGHDGSSYAADLRHQLRYDLTGRMVQEINQSTRHDPPGSELTTHRTRSRRFDQAGQMISETDATTITTGYAYDSQGRRVGVRDALGRVYVDTFDSNGNLLSHSVLRQPAGSSTKVAYVVNRYLYDQANRRVGSGETILGNAVAWSFTKLDERGYARINRNPTGHETSCDYDVLGNKKLELGRMDPAQPITDRYTQSWGYSLNTTDYTVGRLTSSKVGEDRTTTYLYNVFGQLRREEQDNDGTAGSRSHTYKPNGLIESVTESLAKGTFGTAGGVDYRTSTETASYEYTAKGQVARDHFTRSSSFESGTFVDGQLESTQLITEPAITRTSYIVYDPHGRVVKVEAPEGQQTPAQATLRVSYTYDELNNRRGVVGEYGSPWSDGFHQRSEKWFQYDAEGRVTLVDGERVNGQIVKGRGTTVSYDGLGRRQVATKFVEHRQIEDLVFDRFRREEYGYDDLDYLTSILGKEIHTNVTIDGDPWIDYIAPDFSSREIRTVDTRGGLLTNEATNNEQFSTENTNTLTTFWIRADGQLQQQTMADRRDPEKSSQTTYFYDTAGILRMYQYHQDGDEDDEDEKPEFTNTYGYSYTSEFGGNQIKRITVDSTLELTKQGFTTNSYDLAGRLWHQLSDLPNEGSRVRTFTYDTEDRALVKTEAIRPESGGITSNREDLLYAEGRPVATLRSGASRSAIFNNIFTPISNAYPAASPTSHLVRDGDTLLGIAQLAFGDSSLWYLIADANGLSFGPDSALPATERGKTYRIPNVVANVHNDNTTFRPYSFADIIGDSTPTPRRVPPPGPSWWEIALVTIAVVAVTVIVAYVTGGSGIFGASYLGTVIAAGIGAALGNAAGQAVTMGLGYQDNFSWTSMAAAGLGGAAGAALGGLVQGTGLAARMVRSAFTTTGDLMGRGIAGERINGNEALFNLAFGMASASWSKHLDSENFKWSRGVDRVLTGAFNPQSGWVFHDKSRTWQNIVKNAVGALTAVVAGATAKMVHTRINYWWTVDGPRPDPGEDWITPRQPARRTSGNTPSTERDAQYAEWVALDTQAQASGDTEYVLVADNRDGVVNYGDKPAFLFAYRNPKTGKIEEYTVAVQPELSSIDTSDPNVRREVDAMTGEQWWILVVDPSTGAIRPVGPVSLVPVRSEPRELPQSRLSPPMSKLEEFAESVEAAGTQLAARRLVDEAVERLIREQGKTLSGLDKKIDDIKKSKFVVDHAYLIREMEQKKQDIINQYAPQVVQSSPIPNIYRAPFVNLPYRVRGIELQGPVFEQEYQYASDIAPEKGVRFGKFGGYTYKHPALANAIGYANSYDWETDVVQVANDLERIARQGHTEIHFATGTHGDVDGTRSLGPKRFLRDDVRSVMETMERHPGLKIIVYNMADPIQASRFDAVQALAADQALPGGASLAAYCFSNLCVNDPGPSTGPYHGPYGYAEGLDRTGPRIAYFQGISTAAFGALSLYGGLEDPNGAVRALKVAGGGLQTIGGVSYAVGYARDSLRMVRFGSALGTITNRVVAPLALIDVSRGMRTKFTSGYSQMSPSEKFLHESDTATTLASIWFPPAVVAALAIHFGVVPIAERGSAYLTPMFMGGISQAYGIPSQYVWGWQ